MSSQISKLNMVNSKLGATMNGQQTTRTLFDTETATVGQSVFDFYQTFSGKSDLESNLNVNKLDSSESMVIKSIYLATNSATVDLSGHLNLNIQVGNNVVLKDFNPAFQSSDRGVSFQRISTPSGTIIEIRLLTDIVIPPQVNFQATLRLSQVTAAAGDKFRMNIKGYGVIFSAGTSF